MMSWRNVQEGDVFLLVSNDGRFSIRRDVTSDAGGGYLFSYEVSDLWVTGRVEVWPTLQEASARVLEWAAT